MDINKLIGTRLAEFVGPDKRDEFIEAMDWKEQTYYEARIGRRVFRVAELAAMAKASGRQVWEFVDARGLKDARSVTLGTGSKPTISAGALLDAFGYSQEASSWRALHSIKETLGDLNSAVLDARRAEEELLAVHPSVSAYEWEGEK